MKPSNKKKLRAIYKLLKKSSDKDVEMVFAMIAKALYEVKSSH